jgi:hypothetical protein
MSTKHFHILLRVRFNKCKMRICHYPPNSDVVVEEPNGCKADEDVGMGKNGLNRVAASDIGKV